MRRMFSKAQIEKIVDDKIGEMPTGDKLYHHLVMCEATDTCTFFLSVINKKADQFDPNTLGSFMNNIGAVSSARIYPASGYIHNINVTGIYSSDGANIHVVGQYEDILSAVLAFTDTVTEV